MLTKSRKEVAIELFKHGHNCAQAVVCAYTDVLNVDDNLTFRLAEGFGGGFGKSGSICGAVSGMSMVASLISCPIKDINHPTKDVTYPLIRQLMEKFEAQHGYLNCRDLLQYRDNTIVDGKKCICIHCVESCCELLDECTLDKKKSK